MKDQIKKSIEAKWHLNQFYIFLGFYLFSIILGLLISLSAAWPGDDFIFSLKITFVILFAFSLFFVPFLLYSFIAYRLLLIDLENYKIYEVTLNQPGTSAFTRGLVLFHVEFVTEEGVNIQRDTKAIWSDHMFNSLKLSDYANKKVKIAYNAKLDRIIIIG